MQTLLVRTQVKYIPVYECAKCGTLEAGSTVTKLVDAISFSELASILNAYQLTSAHMPEGWQFNGEFICRRHG